LTVDYYCILKGLIDLHSNYQQSILWGNQTFQIAYFLVDYLLLQNTNKLDLMMSHDIVGSDGVINSYACYAIIQIN